MFYRCDASIVITVSWCAGLDRKRLRPHEPYIFRRFEHPAAPTDYRLARIPFRWTKLLLHYDFVLVFDDRA
jgi:hypothetical protein